VLQLEGLVKQRFQTPRIEELTDWDIIVLLVKDHGYSIKGAIPLVHQTRIRLKIDNLTPQKIQEVVNDILSTNPILSRPQLVL
jgi:hypothetical protein